MQYLNEDFQKRIWEKKWEDLLPYNPLKKTSFYSWYSSVPLSEDEELKYESKKMKFGEFYINSHLRFRFPESIENKEIIFTYDETLTTQKGDGLSEISILLDSGKNYLIQNLDELDNPIKSKKVDLTKRELIYYTPVYYRFITPPSKKRDFITLSSRMVSLNDRKTAPMEAGNGDGGWDALDFIKINDYTIKVFMTNNLDFPNFHDLVFNITFPATLKECEVGFWDNPDFHKGL